MAEYIDREVLQRNIKEEIEACGEEDSVYRPIAYGSIFGLKRAMAYANALPTANVVEVVRCKDCCYANENGDVCRYGVGRYTKPDKYCSDGERRDDDG